MRFRSAVDGWFYLVVIGSMVVVTVAMDRILETPTLANVIFATAIFLIAVALPLWVLLGTVYRVEAEQLTIRSGPFKWTIRLNEITAVTPSRSPLWSPALSLDRLEIVHAGGKRILVSPRNHEQFIAAIEQPAPLARAL